MKNLQFRFILSTVALFSIWMTSTLSVNAAPVKFRQIRQIINAKPGKAATGAFEQLRLVGDDPIMQNGDDKTKNGGDNPPAPTTTAQPQQDDGRVIIETSSEIVEDDVCDCDQVTEKGRFPYALLALGAIPLLFLIPRGKHTPTPPPPNTPPTETPTETPTPTPTMTPTPPPVTPTPPPEPVPEPMTILLFGTGLAGVGMAARKRLSRKDKTDQAPEIQ